MECVYAIVVPGFTVRNSTFHNCAVMDLFFTYGDWWNPLPPTYGNVTIEGNSFETLPRQQRVVLPLLRPLHRRHPAPARAP